MKFRQLEFPSDDYSLTVARHCEEDFWTNGRTLLVRGTVRMEHVLDKGFLPSETSTEEINAEPWDMSDKNASTLDDETTVGLLTDLFKDVDLLLSSLDRYNEIKPRDPRNGRKVVQVTDRSRNRLSTLRRK
ncbi:MAG: hypothetical protein KVP17_000868 [Porospora cf. gigantea B]|nr:MAG: hypothetical protein KVP17_000868 [Porospora cf. gigantea B]